MPPRLPSIEADKRAVIAGRTGSGKTTLACWLLSRSRQHWIIFNPKHTKGYNNLEGAETLRSFVPGRVDSSIMRSRFTIINFPGAEANAEFMDDCVNYLHGTYNNIGLCADELYTLHSTGGRQGPGLTGWLTRGRELKQSFLGLTQRPAFVSRFLFSEADYIGGMNLTTKEDRKRMYEHTGQQRFERPLQPQHWLWYDVGRDHLEHWQPVPIRKAAYNLET